MPVVHYDGDLLKSPCKVIAHGCNCFCTMGSGVARVIREKYPGTYVADCKTTSGDRTKLGTLSSYKADDGVTVFNLYTQYNYGTEKIQLDYGALTAALMKFKNHLDKMDPERTLEPGLPRIGCGLAGGKWENVEMILNVIFTKRNIRVYTL